VPTGKFVVTGKAQFDLNADLAGVTATCTLEVSDAANLTGPFTDGSAVALTSPGTATLPLSAVADLPSGGAAVLNCVGDRVQASNVKLTAIQVGSLSVTP
jgi:hypothetical protein